MPDDILHSAVSCAKMAEPIDLPFGLWTRVGRKKHKFYRIRQAPSKKGTAPHFSANVYCGQTAGWIKMPLGTEVDLGPGHTVLDGASSSPQKGAQQLLSFRPMSIVAKRPPISVTAELL